MKTKHVVSAVVALACLLPFSAQAQEYAVSLAQPYTRELGVGLGLRANVGYQGGNELALYGAGAVIRFVPTHRFALEVTIDGAGSTEGYAVPVGLSGLFFFNSDGHIQPYLLGGINMNVMETEHELVMVYAGGHVGAGVEFLVGRRLGITLDARTFLQGAAVKKEAAELEFGVAAHTGFNFYF